MQDLESYQRGLFAQEDVDLNACIETCLLPDALEPPRRPLSAERRLALLDEGIERGHLEEPASVTRSAIQHGTQEILSSDAGAELRRQYDVRPGALNFLGVWD